MTPQADFADDPPLHIGLCGTVGMGKTHAIVQRTKAVLAADPDARIFIAAPDHELARDLSGRVQAALGTTVPVEIWRGTEQPDPAAPSGAPVAMCRRTADAKAVREAGGELADLCGSVKRGRCQHHPNGGGDCGYLKQAQRMRTARVVVGTHAMLPMAAPQALQRSTAGAGGQTTRIAPAHFVFIDEDFTRSMLSQRDGTPVLWLDPASLPTVPADPKGLEPPSMADAAVRAVLARLATLCAKAGHGDRLERAALDAAGLTTGDCRDAARYVLRLKADLPRNLLPGAATGAATGVLGAMATDNARVLWLRDMLTVAGNVLAGNLGSAAIRVFVGGRARTVSIRWRRPIHDDWFRAPGGMLYADATMNEAITRVWIPAIRIARPAPVAAPHMRVTQVTDRVFGYTAVIGSKNSGPQGGAAAVNNALRVRRLIDTLAARYKGKGRGKDVLVVLPKALDDAWSGKLPGNVGTLHFGKLRGQDQYKDVAALLIVSRPVPAPEIVEDHAEIVFGGDAVRIPAGQFYEKRPAVRVMAGGTGLTTTTSYHPDPNVEALRWAACEAELIQAVGRGRGIHRTAGDPLDVFILTNVPLDAVPVTSAVTLDAIWCDLAGGDPVKELARAGVLPMDWPGRGAALASLGFFGRARDKGDAARDWFKRNADGRTRLADFERLATGVLQTRMAEFSPVEPIIGENSAIRVPGTYKPVISPPQTAKPAWSAHRYRLLHSRKAAVVWVRDDHADARVAAERLMGAFALFHPIAAPAPVLSSTEHGHGAAQEREALSRLAPPSGRAAPIRPRRATLTRRLTPQAAARSGVSA